MQKSKKVTEKDEKLNVNLIFLPPYSLNLNLIERLWKFLCKKILANKYYGNFQEFFLAIESFIKIVHISFGIELSSLLFFNFELLDSSWVNGC